MMSFERKRPRRLAAALHGVLKVGKKYVFGTHVSMDPDRRCATKATPIASRKYPQTVRGFDLKRFGGHCVFKDYS